MKDLAGDRQIDAALDARTPTPAKAKRPDTRDQKKRGRLGRVEGRTRRYLSNLRKAARQH
jgi:hypothetical protein